MRTKILILGLICFFIFAYCKSPADPEIEKALEPERQYHTETEPPTIHYFYATLEAEVSYCFHWKVTPEATTVFISWLGNIGLPTTGSGYCFTPYETKTYTLVATNSGGTTTASITLPSRW